ncbi:MAG: molecular chaperone TorD family protein [Rhodospirillales bacterium]|nr:molecular chaperone TorD family protein [Rhodospirillales bacterium]MDH3791584.1 molecular chaperone TorD family protein [Rhodospirillales bacterium]MDH3910609.1 molecular chaperone TorD family protein [Rhodospirillales bacterium]MDH3917200.1 molecular chaperone TorD family protein [Rhodospirillales bacterium]MDH3965894.1 molecular chaperone TorD family protein [Rhodospirillales bacterium]
MAAVLQAQQAAEEDRLRAGWYSLLARLLAAPADDEVIAVLRGLGDDETELGAALRALKAAAGAASPSAVEQEFFDLFVGVGQGELVPYGSYYLTGFLHEKPLARLRDDMAALRIARSEGVPESEDHIAALCDMMAGLITGAFGAPADLATQRKFFDDHIGCWAPRFFENLEAAPSAAFYMPVGTLGRLFMAVESQAFEMAA